MDSEAAGQDKVDVVIKEEDASITKGSKAKKKKKTLADYVYYVGSSTQASDYKSTTDYLINHIREKSLYSNDVGDTLEDQEMIDTDDWKPTLERSTNSDPEDRETENKQYLANYKIEYAEYRDRLKTYENNLASAYSTLWEHCSKTMQTRIKAMASFDARIKKNPIELLKAIRQHALDFQEDRYALRIIADAIVNFVLTKQREDERLEDFTTGVTC